MYTQNLVEFLICYITDDNEQFLQELENQPSPLPEEQGPKAIIAGSGNDNVNSDIYPKIS